MLGRDTVGQQPADVFVKHGANLIDLFCFLERQAFHRHTVILFGAQQPGLFKCAKSFSHRAARNTQTRSQLRLVQLVTRSEFAAENQTLEFILHERRQRMLFK